MIKKLTEDNFKPFGHLIYHPQKHLHDKNKNLFHVVLREGSNVGWRIAYLIVRDKTIGRLEQHLESFESFEPVSGKTILYVAREKNSSLIQCFNLDRPVILDKGIWHGLITLNGDSEIKITENADIKCLYWKLGFTLKLSRKCQKSEDR